MTSLSKRCRAGAGAVAVAVITVVPGVVDSSSSPQVVAVAASRALPLGRADLSEVRTTTTVQPGVTLTTIVRGAVDPSHTWTVEVSIAGGPGSPDPDAAATALSDRASAQAQATRLRAGGFDPRIEEVRTPPTADYPGGNLGWRVRVGRLSSQSEADAVRLRVVAAGFAASSRFTGWDPTGADRGPWRLHVLTVDPKAFTGSLLSTYGADLQARETTSSLSRATGATAAVNGGYFVLDPLSGAPGDPAGVGVYRGRLLSETVGRRPALVLHDDARGTAVQRLRWVGHVQSPDGHRLPLDGIDRVPGLVRNCGGRDDRPTTRPLHDFTCTDPDEVVAFTTAFGTTTPAGPGLEAVLDRRQRVVSLRSPRGGPLLPGYRSVQATGSSAESLRAATRLGSRLQISSSLRAGRRPVQRSRELSVVNGGPELVRGGRMHVTPRTDGFVRATNPSFYYGFSAQRNPRTFAGVDARGRTLLATVDGRSTTSLGLSIVETARVAQALGMRDALNLDGGGSTSMVVDSQVVNQPSDPTGERPVGDAVLVLPRTR